MQPESNVDLSQILYYKIGPKVKTLFRIASESDLLSAIDFIKQKHIKKILPVGIGANLLVNDVFFDGVVLWFVDDKQATSLRSSEDGVVEAFAGVQLDDVIEHSFSHNLIGLEWAGGLPSTVGAAVRGNVGCFGKEIKDVFLKAKVLDMKDPLLQIQEMSYSDLAFSYRNSFAKQHPSLLLITCYFQLQHATKEQVAKAKQVYESNIAYRKTHHPITYPNCGSIFKNIVKKEEVEKIIRVWPDIQELIDSKWHGKVAMGNIVKQLGFSGKQVGEAQVSDMHANYIINKNHAKFADVITLITEIKQKFSETFGFMPETEVEIVR